MTAPLRILYVDDNPHDRDLVRDVLEQEHGGFIVTEASTRAEFQTAFKRGGYDLILSDFNILGYDGLQVLETVHTSNPDLPVIIVTGTGSEEVAVEAMKRGAADYVIKSPSHIQRLPFVVHAVLERQRLGLEREEHLRMLLDADERFRQITDAIHEVVWMTDIQKSEMLFVSTAYQEIWGRSCESLLADPSSWIETIHPDDRVRVQHDALPKQISGEYNEEYRIIRPDGETRWIHDRAFPIRDNSGQVFRIAGLAEDITKRKQAEADMRKNELRQRDLELQLIQAQKLESLGMLASGIAHDFNNILGIIMGHSSLLGGAPLDQTKAKSSLEAIQKATNRGASLVKQLLTFARKSDAIFQSIRINEVVDDVLGLLSETLPKMIVVSTDLTEKLPSVFADGNQIHQVLLNLCVNARDAMPGGGTLSIRSSSVEGNTVRMKYPAAKAPDYVLVRVADTGTGMDEATRLRIFDPFFTTKGVGKGTGLGLAVVHSIITQHEGFIDVTSEQGKGTSFQLYLPVQPQEIEIKRSMEQGVMQTIPGGSETVLVVEDEEMLRELVNAVLTSKGYRVLTAIDGEDGLNIFMRFRNEIGVVITDLGLPKFGGDELFRSIRAVSKTVPVIIASGFIDPALKEDLLKAGPMHFVQKPYSANEVLLTLREVLDPKQ